MYYMISVVYYPIKIFYHYLIKTYYLFWALVCIFYIFDLLIERLEFAQIDCNW